MNDHTKIEFTRAAELAINEIVDDFRKELIILTQKAAMSRVPDADTASISDVMEAWNVVGDRLRARSNSQQRERQLLFWASVAGIGLLVGMTFNLVASLMQGAPVPSVEPRLDSNVANILTWLGVMMGAITVIVTIVVIIQQHTIESSTTKESAYALLMDRWLRYEQALRSFTVRQLGESQAAQPYGEIFRFVESRGIFSRQDIQDIESARQLRNAVAHGREESGKEDVERAAKALERVTKKLVTTDLSR